MRKAPKPTHSLKPALVTEIERQTNVLALALNVSGLMNVQYAIKDGDIYVLEVNPRASRTVPFVAKVIGKPFAKIAARIMPATKTFLPSHKAVRTRTLHQPGRRRVRHQPGFD